MAKTTDKNASVRLDKWLWAARFYKTRALAKEMINSGKIHYNGQRTKSSKVPEIGARIRLRQGFDEKEVIVDKVFGIRQNATLAQTLYTETDESIKKREINAEARRLNILNNPAPDTKPDKKQRRQIIRFRQTDN